MLIFPPDFAAKSNMFRTRLNLRIWFYDYFCQISLLNQIICVIQINVTGGVLIRFQISRSTCVPVTCCSHCHNELLNPQYCNCSGLPSETHTFWFSLQLSRHSSYLNKFTLCWLFFFSLHTFCLFFSQKMQTNGFAGGFTDNLNVI